jgi:hypothetical protein
MPARWLCVVIVAFWLGLNGWLFWHDVWPDLRPGEPPPFTIDLIDEVELNHPEVGWRVFHNGKEIYRARTQVLHEREDDTTVLVSTVTPNPLLGKRQGPFRDFLTLEELKSVYRVGPEGNLHGLELYFDGLIKPAFLAEAEGIVHLLGEVRDGQIVVRYTAELCHFTRDGGKLHRGEVIRSWEGQLDPVPVSHHGSVLSPMHPVHRIQGLRPGRTWRMPYVDPWAQVLASTNLPGFSAEVRYLNARVLASPEVLIWRESETACLVIEYEGENCQARTWIDKDSGLVLRQEAICDGDTWAMQRER